MTVSGAAAASGLPPALVRAVEERRDGGGYSRTGQHAEFFLERGQILAAAALMLEREYFLEDIVGVDVLEGILVVYHFDRFDVAHRVALRLLIPHEDKRVQSIAGLYSGADWHERECHDFFGVIFEGHPNLRPLLLPDDLGRHPLLKERDRRSLYGLLPLPHAVEAGGGR